MAFRELRVVVLTWAVAAGGWVSSTSGVIQTFSDSGGLPSDIQDTVDAFRDALGTLNPNVAGSFLGGRREINWDGVPDAFAAPNQLPFDFFSFNSPRGVFLATPGTGFQVSADFDNPSGAPTEFDNIDPQYSTYFAPFSPQRLFTSVGSNITDVHFVQPGTSVPATVRGFGAVFTDVDTQGSTTLSFFNLAGQLVASEVVPPFNGPSLSNNNGGQSFLGLTITEPEDQIARVRIQSGFEALGAGSVENPIAVGDSDLVVMDDFIFAEPVAIPEPSAAVAILGLALLRRRRR